MFASVLVFPTTMSRAGACATYRTSFLTCGSTSRTPFFASSSTGISAFARAGIVTTASAVHYFVFNGICNHRISQQRHSTDNRQCFFGRFLEELSSVLSFVVFVVFHRLFCQVIIHLARRDRSLFVFDAKVQLTFFVSIDCLSIEFTVSSKYWTP